MGLERVEVVIVTGPAGLGLWKSDCPAKVHGNCRFEER